MRIHFVRTNGVTLCCRDLPGGAPTLVLLPGLTVSGAFFGELVGSGLSPRFRTVALDLRGRGRSEAPPGGPLAGSPAANYTMCDHAADVLGALESLDIQHPILVGHSFGGMLALYLAAHAPKRFPRIVVLDAAISLATQAVRDQLKPVLDRLEQVNASWDEYIAAVKRLPYFCTWWTPAIEEYYRDDVWTDRHGMVRPRARPDAIRAAVEGLLQVDWPSIISRVTQPVLLVNATGSYGPPGSPAFLTREGAEETAEGLADCRLLTAPGNHITMAYGENAPGLAKAITAFAAGYHDMEIGQCVRCRKAAHAGTGLEPVAVGGAIL